MQQLYKYAAISILFFQVLAKVKQELCWGKLPTQFGNCVKWFEVLT